MNTVKILTITLSPALDHSFFVKSLLPGKVNRAQGSQYYAGGKGINVASFLSDMGYPVSVSGFLGDKNTGIFEEHFKKRSLQDRFIRIPGYTRTGIKIVEETSQETTDINFAGLTPDEQGLAEFYSAFSELVKSHEWIVLAGSVPSGLEDAYTELLQRAKALKRTVVLDSSGPALGKALSLAPDIIKPNRDELEEYCKRPVQTQAEIITAAQEILQRGTKTVIVSLGEEGAIFVEKGVALLAKPPQAEVVSTVGAGDAMVAGIIHAKLQGLSLSQAAQIATAFSLCALASLELGIPSKEKLIALSQKVMVQNVSKTLFS